MPLQETSGAASYDAFGGGAPAAPIYIEDVFSTWLYQGNGSGQTITNGIDLAGKGGMVWAKARNEPYSHELFDTARGSLSALISNTADSQNSYGPYDFLSSGFRYRAGYIGNANYSNTSYVSWTFRKQPKFFDVVLYTGDGTNNRAIPHNLNSVPGCIIVKATSASLGWGVKHRSLTASQYLVLNDTAAASTALDPWSQNPTSNEFYVNGTAPSLSNGNGIQYVAYLFAHNAGGFGLTGTDNVISCGSIAYPGSETRVDINLGWEPQYVLIKASGTTSQWVIVDSMRGFPAVNVESSNDPTSKSLRPNLSNAEGDYSVHLRTNGFSMPGGQFPTSEHSYIYIAIRRGPMKVPTTGTSVFSPNLSSAGTGTQITTGFPVDAQISNVTTGGNHQIYDRLRGVTSTTTQSAQYLITNLTGQEFTTTNDVRAWNNTGFQLASGLSGIPVVYWNFRRAPGFFDEVCYTGDGSGSRSITHNLGVAPELIIVKRRNSTGYWATANKLGNFTGALDSTAANAPTSGEPTTTNGYINAFGATATAFQVLSGNSGNSAVNANSSTYVAYLFASAPGVSKVGSYTGNGSSQTINCGFTGGARFVMIKRTDNTGDWYVWDTARGIVSGNDPHLSLNTTAAEVTTDDTIDTDSTGFVVNQVSATNVNVSSATYIFLAIA
jgi:hypothetical protein